MIQFSICVIAKNLVCCCPFQPFHSSSTPSIDDFGMKRSTDHCPHNREYDESMPSTLRSADHYTSALTRRPQSKDVEIVADFAHILIYLFKRYAEESSKAAVCDLDFVLWHMVAS